MGMIDHDKVIMGLKCCKDMHTAGSGYAQSCIECPYKDVTPDGMMGFACIRRLFRENIALLEAQKPRVMTLDEVISAEMGTVMWLEDYNKPTVIPGLVDGVFIMEKMIDFQLVRIIVTADLDEYGERWRCWTERPTDEQRIATPWENYKEGGCNGDYCEIN